MKVKKGKTLAGPAAWLAGLFFVILLAAGNGGRDTDTLSMGTVLKEYVAARTQGGLLKVYVPVFSFVEEDSSGPGQQLVERQMDQMMPLYCFWSDHVKGDAQVEDRMTIEMILMAEANEECGSLPEDGPGEEDGAAEGDNGDGNSPGTALEALPEQSLLDELLMAENAASGLNLTPSAEFVPHTKMAQVDLESMRVYENLVSSFYTVDRSTMAGSDQLNVDKLGGKDLTVSKDTEGPQILIYHTHSQEAFADSVPGDASTTIVGVGDYLAQVLTEKYGYQVLHHTGQYDVETRDDAYSRALPAIEQVLAEHPTIQVVIDLHRDAMAEETHLVMDLDGRPTARFMFFNGLSRTRKTGNISYLYNENLEDNLAFSYQMQVKAMEYYPGLTRKIYLKGYRYNMHLKPRTLLVELGAQNNSVEEAMNACDPLAHILDMVLSGE